ncbi:MAG: hypothetical protein A2W85_10410 [Bacteroidetes bacterium GWF2_41_31]|nr:MAG: hypothetical protein A2W85_10410 [Bacteroidetes bacterium GWF2_41_31]
MNNTKKENVITLIPKVIILLILSFGIKLFFSCTPYSQDPIEINYNHISVIGIDNSDRYLDYYNTTDTIYSDAVALKLTLSDTSMFYAATFSSNLMQTFSFQTARAYDIEPSYIPLNKVVDIKVKTLIDINESLKAGDDISEHILCSSRDDFDMYHNLSQGISWLDDIQSRHKSSSIILVLKTSIKNTNAQFEVKVTLDNGNELFGTTVIFTII